MANKIIIIFVLTSTFCFGQKDKFNLLESGFNVGSRFTTWQIKYDNKDDETFDPESNKMLDSIVWFMNKNPEIVIEVQDHRDKNSNIQHSLKSAQNIVGELIKKGIAASRLSAKGFGGNIPYIQDSIIKKHGKKEIKDKLRMKSLRTVFQIKCNFCYSREDLLKARYLTEIFPIYKNLPYKCQMGISINGILHQVQLSGPDFEFSPDARLLLHKADIGSILEISFYPHKRILIGSHPTLCYYLDQYMKLIP